ncbi:MAG: hypothetical protein JRI27_10975 [Deltaproteobacteria bacterium]|nr:hypothetical protein [Deltaproteobacteria bacterium]
MNRSRETEHCVVCGRDIEEARYIHYCDCGPVHDGCAAECEVCERMFCRNCIASASEVGGGFDVANTGWNCCYACAEDGGVEKIIEWYNS